MLEVKEKEDGSFEILWDPDDPVESVLNAWTEADFLKVLRDQCQKVLGEESDNGNV